MMVVLDLTSLFSREPLSSPLRGQVLHPWSSFHSTDPDFRPTEGVGFRMGFNYNSSITLHFRARHFYSSCSYCSSISGIKLPTLHTPPLLCGCMEPSPQAWRADSLFRCTCGCAMIRRLRFRSTDASQRFTCGQQPAHRQRRNDPTDPRFLLYSSRSGSDVFTADRIDITYCCIFCEIRYRA